MNDTTRIMDLPENVTMQLNTREQATGANTSYTPMDIHPNPYGHPPPSVPSMPTPSGNNPSMSASPPSSQMQYAIPPTQQHLPSRDIPMDMGGVTQDPQVQPNYVPPVPEEVKQTAEYMKRYDDITQRKVQAHLEEKHQTSRMDTLYEEGQIPILVAVLFFIFHMPIVSKYLYQYLSFLKLHDVDGHFNMYGLIMQSILFGSVFYGFSKGVHIASNF
jgi:hypothetical protein